MKALSVLVDSNVLLDVLTEDQRWFSWSARALARCADEAALVINPIIYAEVSIGFALIEDLEEALRGAPFRTASSALGSRVSGGEVLSRLSRARRPQDDPPPGLLHRRARRRRRSVAPDSRQGSLPHLFPKTSLDRAVERSGPRPARPAAPRSPPRGRASCTAPGTLLRSHPHPGERALRRDQGENPRRSVTRSD